MVLLTWNTKYSVGVKALDDQHTILFGLLNDLHSAMMKGEAQRVTGPLLRKLVNYTHTHFTSEEKMMEATEYPGLAAHRAQHRELMNQVQDYSARFERVEVTLSFKLLIFLRDWLTAHIEKDDRQYGPWLNERGIY